jgi:acylphosphatase
VLGVTLFVGFSILLSSFLYNAKMIGSDVKVNSARKVVKQSATSTSLTAAGASTAAITYNSDRDGAVTQSFRATGKVQRVMFRQTLIRAMQKRGLTGGATNLKVPQRNQVEFTVSGEESNIQELVLRFLDHENPINDRKARADSIKQLSKVIPIEQHTVTTTNVDKFKWKSCKMFI